MADPCLADARQAPPEDRLRALARDILEERERRQWHFPRAIFGEVPWEMLLLLYALGPRSISRASVANGILAPPPLVDRWSDYLEREGLVASDLGRPPALRLTSSGLASLDLYLRDRLQRSGSANAKGGAPGLSGRRLSLLLLGTAILSGSLAWALASR